MPCTVLVTGANRGLGLEFTRQLLARGEAVIATCRQPAQATALQALGAAHPGRLQVLALDVASEAARAQFTAALEDTLAGAALDLLINNAGVLQPGERFGQVTQAALEESLRVNAIGPFLLTQALAAFLRDGAIVANLSSQLGSIARVVRFGTPSYCAGKAAQNMLGAQLAQALAPRGIVVLQLHPGWVQTDMGGPQASLSAQESAAGLLQVIERATPAQSGTFLDWQGQTLPW
ncbi:SDR family oxidoreductase [Thermomonas sp.]|jgi:NAD(P)-dependent dehydrogenase (short-subunit alcohol dehydrogenase family)|uniref:SDR family oxidoreductase n=1 Tax=Thermomonas sp. TaxID=1971895 RepID=UPI001ACD9676|nr:SDR family oxidoreductase [Xanthomonadales bacterium]MBN8768339.1 SDR family oxidoreductase [Stenotrophomonas sp.]